MGVQKKFENQNLPPWFEKVFFRKGGGGRGQFAPLAPPPKKNLDLVCSYGLQARCELDVMHYHGDTHPCLFTSYNFISNLQSSL